jgi:hypothetical protein
MLEVEHGANDPIPEKSILLRNHRGGQDPHRVVVPVKKKRE